MIIERTTFKEINQYIENVEQYGFKSGVINKDRYGYSVRITYPGDKNMDPLIMTQKFNKFHEENPHVFEAFVRITLAGIQRGKKNAGAKLIIEVLRWETPITGNDEFKINNNYASYYARKFMSLHPEYKNFFRLKPAAADGLIKS